MATQDQSKAVEAVVEAVVEDSEEVKKLLSVMDALGDSINQVDRAKFEGLIERARNQQV